MRIARKVNWKCRRIRETSLRRMPSLSRLTKNQFQIQISDAFSIAENDCMMKSLLNRFPSIPFVLPFGVFVVLLGLRSFWPFDPKWEYPTRAIISTAALLLVSKGVIARRIAQPLFSVIIGVLVFAVWVMPDLLWPSYHQHWLFQNRWTGSPQSSLNSGLRTDIVFLAFRIFGTAILVPVIEELFWRGWLMRYLINPEFKKVPLGAYSGFAFCVSVLLFASEHGSFWDVGIVAGAAYNWWIIRTKTLADCILAHAVTNACLAVYVIGFNQWQFWL